MKHVAIFRVSGSDALRMYQALLPETGDMGRTRVNLHMEGDETLVLSVSAADLSALRAALNTWLRLMNIAHEMQEVVKYE
jgi:KEOPS complex subunit Pcc1